MKTTILILCLSLMAVLINAQDNKIILKADSQSVLKFKESESQLNQINSLLKARNKDYSPDYRKWTELNKQLQSFVSSPEINLFEGIYLRDISFYPLIKEHKYRLVVNIQYPWMNTGIDLEKDKTYVFIASGLASTSNSILSLWIGPEGRTNDEAPIPMYSLIGKLGENNKPFYIGKMMGIKPNETNRLFLGYNDDLYIDNIGYYVVDIFELSKKDVIKMLKKKKLTIGKYYIE